eukprot:TRINITY_DN14114_c0_g1_i1.p1 TRINITY_DN14114_c0_g1~~TRINITY_DN14114_c0_g1_i1.p1  ORF type:complete len:430 (-),score=65.31 TRINITY_DN14114_c0_g1_i1:56-1345(-)
MEDHGVKLVGYDNFVRNNPKSDRFESFDFHHVEFYCGDVQSVSRRFAIAMGMQQVAKSDQTTGNQHYTSVVLKSNNITFVFSAPYSRTIERPATSKPALPHFNVNEAHEFFAKHGFGAKAVGITVTDAKQAYEVSTANGAVGVTEPQTLTDSSYGGKAIISEIKLYGDAVLRFVQLDNFDGPFLPGYAKAPGMPLNYGLTRVDHIVGNVPKLLEQVGYMIKALGFHEFAEFTAEDVGTVDSGLNSMVLANNTEHVLLPINEPTFGTPRKSQIQTYLEHNEGPGVQHIAIKTDNIFNTMRLMRKMTPAGGFDFQARPSEKYYRNLPNKVGDSLTAEELKQVEELGLLVDKDDQGVLIQIFTTPIADRPTVFLEIIQRVGCMESEAVQTPGCGGFGKGNFSELFKSIEDYERTLDGPSVAAAAVAVAQVAK